MHQMVHMRGDIALSANAITREIIVRRPKSGHVPLVKSTMAEDQSNSHSKSKSPSLATYHLESPPLKNKISRLL